MLVQFPHRRLPLQLLRLLVSIRARACRLRAELNRRVMTTTHAFLHSCPIETEHKGNKNKGRHDWDNDDGGTPGRLWREATPEDGGTAGGVARCHGVSFVTVRRPYALSYPCVICDST